MPAFYNKFSQEKIESAKAILGKSMEAGNPAVMLSFGKDSVVLMDLIEGLWKRNPFSPRGFPIPVVYLRDPWFSDKNAFADRMIKEKGMQVHDWPPAFAGVQVKKDALELAGRYSVGGGYYMDMAKVTTEEGDFICGLRDFIMRPKVETVRFPFDKLIIGHKNSDVDLFHGPCPLKGKSVELMPGLTMDFPLYDWTNEDIWGYIEDFDIPYQKNRYSGRTLLEDKSKNNDWIHACTRCIDPREKEKEVFCPKLQRNVPSIGQDILQFKELAPYITQ